jgi:hypothetical protein
MRLVVALKDGDARSLGRRGCVMRVKEMEGSINGTVKVTHTLLYAFGECHPAHYFEQSGAFVLWSYENIGEYFMAYEPAASPF